MPNALSLCERIPQAPQLHLGNAGLRLRYPIETAAWLWHPDNNAQFVEFKLELDLSKDLVCEISISGDQRYQFFVDGQRVSRGPDRGDLEHWSFAVYALSLTTGKHVLSAKVWHVGRHAPLAQTFFKPGFICHAQGEADALISTGTGKWKVSKQDHISFTKISIPYYIAIGSSSVTDCSLLKADKWLDPVVVKRGSQFGNTGVAVPGWKLCPSTLPEQIDRLFAAGAIRAVSADWETNKPLPEKSDQNPVIQDWQAVIGGKAITIAANQRVQVLWDLEDYYCGYSEISLSNGKDARIEIEWAESLYEAENSSDGVKRSNAKGDRNAFIGKIWLGFGDTIVADGNPHSVQNFWWRAGRYVLLRIQTQSAPLTINNIKINETRYPLEYRGSFNCDDAQIQDVIQIAVRGMQMCSHETYMDCPYYEQLMYVGDTRLEMLCAHVMDRDDNLVKRGIELFDWSRVNWGFVNERYPCYEPQHSPTFSLIWVSLLHDYAQWRDDTVWVTARLIGLRSMLEHFEPYLNQAGLLDQVPGWTFTDWVPAWNTGYPPDGEFGCSGIINLLYLMALQKAAELELAFGESIMQQRYAEKAARLKLAIQKAFWNEKDQVFADNLSHSEYSEHSQCLGLLTEAVPAASVQPCLNALLSRPDLKRCTIYFSFYLFEVLQRFNLADQLHQKYGFWKDLVHIGMKTPVEAPEPRSDCHAWGSHPLFHLHASVTGVRPNSFGFKSVLIKPLLGHMKTLSCVTPHPQGEIKVSYEKATWDIELPTGLNGQLELGGNLHVLKGGKQRITV